MKISNFNDVQKAIVGLEKRIKVLEGKKQLTEVVQNKAWFRPGGSTEKIIQLIREDFFNTTRSIAEIVVELKTKDYHLKASDLTMALRSIVRHGYLKKTKIHSSGKASKYWLYIKVK